MTIYVDSAYYRDTFKGITIPDADIDSYLTKATRNIDQLTYFRIVRKGFANITAFQQDYIKMAVCEQADHLYNYGDILSPNLDGYSVGGNSVKFGSNVDMRYSRVALDYLLVTGLTYRGLGGGWTNNETALP